jgi:hypothetical protein
MDRAKNQVKKRIVTDARSEADPQTKNQRTSAKEKSPVLKAKDGKTGLPRRIQLNG